MRLVVKIGSSSLVDEHGAVRADVLDHLVADVAAAVAAGHQVVLVSSGAIATGLGLLGHTRRPKELPALQAASAVGQGALFAAWSARFLDHGMRAGQVLLTMHDAAHRSTWVNARGTLEQLLGWGVVPVVNENDTTATDEITFGDNDSLAAQVAVAVGADALLLLTDTDGIYTEHPANPGAERIDVVDDRTLLARIDTASSGSHWGSGGMRSKVVAAEMACTGGITTHIARAGEPGLLGRLLAGDPVGTRVEPDERRGSSFKLWLRHAKPAAGTVLVDAGAGAAVRERGASLLTVGVRGVEGEFLAGDAVFIAEVGEGREAFAKGIVQYAAGELARLVQDPRAAREAAETVHRDQLVLVRIVDH